jgi:hypothetical protein
MRVVLWSNAMLLWARDEDIQRNNSSVQLNEQVREEERERGRERGADKWE